MCRTRGRGRQEYNVHAPRFRGRETVAFRERERETGRGEETDRTERVAHIPDRGLTLAVHLRPAGLWP